MRSWLLSIAIIVAPAVARAQTSREPMLDARGAAMGQAGVADEAGPGAAVDNPAALAGIHGTRFGATIAATVIQGGKVSFDTSGSSLLAGDAPRWSNVGWMPSAIGVAREIPAVAGLVVGLSGMVIRDDQGRIESSLAGIDAGLDSASRFEREMRWRRILFGPSAAMAFEPIALRIGVSVLGSLSEMNSHAFLVETVSANSGLARSDWSEVDDLRSTAGLTAVLGAQWDPLSFLSLGAVLRPGDLATFTRSGSVHRITRQIGAAGGGGTFAEAPIDQAAVPDPTELRLGLLLRPTERLKIAVDLLYAFDQHGPSLGLIDLASTDLVGNATPELKVDRIEERLSTREALNVSAGISFSLDERWSLAAGFLTDRSLTGPGQSAGQDGERTVAWVRWPKREQYLGTLGASFHDGAIDLSGGVGLGAVNYRSNDVLLAGGASDTVVGFSGRLFLSAGLRLE